MVCLDSFPNFIDQGKISWLLQKIDYLLTVVRSGLIPRSVRPKKVIIIGMGMAGLAAGYESKRAGHDVTILKATQRVGGRVLTTREPFFDG